MTKNVIIVFILLCITSVYSQKDKPNEEDISFAKSLREKYDDEDVVIRNKKIEVFFNRNSKTNKVEVKESKTVEYIGISKRADLGYSSGYDNESSIVLLELLDNRKKEVHWRVYDEAYSSESIFHNDYRIKYGTFSLPLQGYTRIVNEEKKYQDIKYFISEYFVERYRILNGKLIIHVPNWLELDTKEFNFEGFDIKSSV